MSALSQRKKLLPITRFAQHSLTPITFDNEREDALNQLD